MSEEPPQIPPEVLSQLADWVVGQGKAKTLFQLRLDMRDAIKSGHPVLDGAVFRKAGKGTISGAISAALNRQLNIIEKPQLKPDYLVSEAVNTRAHQDTAAISVERDLSSGRVANYLDELGRIACSRCQREQLVLWSNITEHLCETCFNSEKALSHPAVSNFQMLFCPQLRHDGTWASKATFSFSVLREFVEKCMRPTTAGNLQKLLASTPPSISALIDLLESRLDSEFSKWFEALRQKRESIRQCRDELDRLNGTFRELDRKMSLEKSPARQILKEEREQVRARATAKQVELQNLSQQIERLEADEVSFPPTHPAMVQRHAIERLRRDFVQWQKGELDFEFKTSVHRVYWNLLEPAGDSWPAVVRHYEYLQRTRNERYELERLKQIHDLRPDVIYIGLAAFEGYVVFVFKKGDIAVLDCPQVGNALYVMEASKWKFFSQLSKTELLNHHQDEVRRIVHNLGWFGELESLLNRHRNRGH